MCARPDYLFGIPGIELLKCAFLRRCSVVLIPRPRVKWVRIEEKLKT